MALKHEYYPSDTIKILNQSEGRAGISGQAAHAMSTHLRHRPAASSNPIAEKPQHTGVGAGVFASRWSNDPYDDKGQFRINSGWLGKGDMVLLLCQLLNSMPGQYALGVLDARGGGTRAVVQHYFAGAKDLFGNTLSGVAAEIRVLPNAPIFSYHNDNPNNPFRGQLKAVTKVVPTYKGVLRGKDLFGAVSVLDNLAGTLHVQTFYPLFTAYGPEYVDYRTAQAKFIVEFPNGKPWVQMTLT